ncbi:hypothetical protein JTB14_032647 [Gonioctena quinquepunctata]|nr:hypothetical protein JTB14_032647 [Gonioctena quinquepunctata]
MPSTCNLVCCGAPLSSLFAPAEVSHQYLPIFIRIRWCVFSDLLCRKIISHSPRGRKVFHKLELKTRKC